MKLFLSPALWVFILAMIASWWAGVASPEVWVVDRVQMDAAQAEAYSADMDGSGFLTAEESRLLPDVGRRLTTAPPVTSEHVVSRDAAGEERYDQLTARSHRGIWSLFPALVTILLCFLTREPVSSLAAGILAGAMLLRTYDVTGGLLIPKLASSNAALVVVLYLCFLGGLLGIWSRNGAAAAFAKWVTRWFVRGPRTAKLAAWSLGCAFFQGGTLSTLLVGTTVKPIADEENISHEELSYIVDSTASPIAILLPFNAWPFYVQGLIFVGGVAALSTEAARVAFFFGAIPLSFYAILAVTFTFLLSIDKLPLIGRSFRAAIKRARETGELDRPGAKPLQSALTGKDTVHPGYAPVAWEFFVPLVLIIGIAVGTFVATGTPEVLWAFGIALAAAYFTSRFRGMPLAGLVEAFNSGLRMVVYGAVILLLAVTIGAISRDTGGGLFLVELLGGHLPFWSLPMFLFAISLVIALATGSSWGTFAVTFPLAMPLAWAVAQSHDLAHPLLFLQICFATVLNGGVFGDQCSPISDTSVLSSLATGCDLMDHIRTQIVPCAFAGGFAVIGWTLLTFFTR